MTWLDGRTSRVCVWEYLCVFCMCLCLCLCEVNINFRGRFSMSASRLPPLSLHWDWIPHILVGSLSFCISCILSSPIISSLFFSSFESVLSLISFTSYISSFVFHFISSMHTHTHTHTYTLSHPVWYLLLYLFWYSTSSPPSLPLWWTTSSLCPLLSRGMDSDGMIIRFCSDLRSFLTFIFSAVSAGASLYMYRLMGRGKSILLSLMVHFFPI